MITDKTRFDIILVGFLFVVVNPNGIIVAAFLMDDDADIFLANLPPYMRDYQKVVL